MREAVVVVTFGTTHARTRARTIDRLVRETAARWPELPVRLAITSPTIRRVLSARGEEALSLTQVLEQLHREEYGRVRLCLTHLICGEEYDRLRGEAEAFSSRMELAVSRPLLSRTEDIRRLAAILDRRYPRRKGQAAVFMGHGTRHYANTVYAALDYTCKNQGRDDFFLASVEGYPFLEDILPQLRRARAERIVLVPLMLVAGEHACSDMAGDGEDSWKNRLLREGFQVETVIQGLGEYEQVREMYLEHFEQAERI